MFGTYFYHQRIRKSVAVFGALFNDIYIARSTASGTSYNQERVPLSYAPKRSFLQRLAENPDLDNTKVAIKLPRMSFEITSFDYDSTRQLQKNNVFNRAGSNINQRAKFNVPVPYNVNFQLNIYAKSQDDALQIVEQIIPRFNPQYSLTIKPIESYPTIVEDTPIILNGVNFSDDYEGDMAQRRTIIYTLDFTMKINFYGPTTEGDIIRQADVDLGIMQGGLNDSDVAVERIRVTTNPADASPDSDYGFTTDITLYVDSA